MAEKQCFTCGMDLTQIWAHSKLCAYCGHQFCDNDLTDYVCAKCSEKPGKAGTGATSWFSPLNPKEQQPQWPGRES